MMDTSWAKYCKTFYGCKLYNNELRFGYWYSFLSNILYCLQIKVLDALLF